MTLIKQIAWVSFLFTFHNWSFRMLN